MINYYSYTKILWKNFFHCLKIFGRLPGVLDTGESIKIANISAKIRENSKRPGGISIGTRRRCLMKKTRNKKSRGTVPLKGQCHEIFCFWFFFTKQLLLVPIEMPSGLFEFWRIFAEIFAILIDSPVSRTPGSRPKIYQQWKKNFLKIFVYE